MAEPTAAAVGIRMRSMSSFSARRAACSGAAPPKAIIVRSASVAPISMACTRAAPAMFSPTISFTPSAAICGARPSGAPTAAASASVAARSSSAMRPPENAAGSMRPIARSASVTVGAAPPWP